MDEAEGAHRREPRAVRVLVSAASRHGATAELAIDIAAGIRRGLAGAGLTGPEHAVVVRPPDDVADVSDFDAVVLGSAVYHGRWLETGRALVLRCAIELWDRPVWIFSSGPVGLPPRPPEGFLDVGEILTLTRPVEHRVFSGRLDRSRLDLAERALVTALRAPEGDFRDRPGATAWGAEIGSTLGRDVGVAPVAGSRGTPERPIGAP